MDHSNPDKNWYRLRDYRCPIIICGFPLQQFTTPPDKEYAIHKCTVCEFQITERRLQTMTKPRRSHVDPQSISEEIDNQQKLNDL